VMSIICSNKFFTKGHKQRFEFCKKLKNHFKDQIDWFGAGVNPLDSKWDGIAPYKYHITLENSCFDDYWTEKLIDPYMAGSYPIYCGAPNIGNYFDVDRQLTLIDVKYPKLAIAKIEKLIADNTYEKARENLITARDLAMDKYNLFNIIAEICAADPKIDRKEFVTLRNEEFFLAKTPKIFIKNKKGIVAKIKNSLVKKYNRARINLIDNFLALRFKLFTK
jgi:hypothetical protein